MGTHSSKHHEGHSPKHEGHEGHHREGSIRRKVNAVRRSMADHHKQPAPCAPTVEAVYEIDDKILGRGHYGVVRKCTHRETKEVCAVKTISKKHINKPEVLHREISILRAVKHENIIEVKDVFEDASHLFIVTELCTGGELFDHIIEKTNSREGHYSEHDAAEIVRQILSAIAYCHKNHIAHRDLKPENFLFTTKTADAKIKIIDFGLALDAHDSPHDDQAAAEAAADRIMTTRVGTPYYIAPEVLARSYTTSCDLWSIGVVTYILLCGGPPFSGDSDAEIFRRVKRGLTKNSFPTEEWQHISKEAVDFIKNLLSNSPGQRMTAKEALESAWIVKTLGGETRAASSVNKPPPLSGDQLASRFKRFVGLSRLKKAALNVLSHHLTEREIGELRKIWSQLDTENKGVISFTQLRDSLRQHGHDSTEAEMQTFTSGLDVNDDHSIDYFEFAAAMLSRNQTIRDDRLKEVFEHMDEGSKGFIAKDDLVKIMGSVAHADEVLHDIGDTHITFDQLRTQFEKL